MWKPFRLYLQLPCQVAATRRHRRRPQQSAWLSGTNFLIGLPGLKKEQEEDFWTAAGPYVLAAMMIGSRVFQPVPLVGWDRVTVMMKRVPALSCAQQRSWRVISMVVGRLLRTAAMCPIVAGNSTSIEEACCSV